MRGYTYYKYNLKNKKIREKNKTNHSFKKIKK
jgi:hypothetical protein